MLIVAHRGARDEEPENTLRAVRRAIACGADAVEVDVRLSGDGELVVIHDGTLERTTDGAWGVGEKTFDELRALDAGKGEKIPLLSEVLSCPGMRERMLVVELKEEGTEEQVIDEVIGAEMEEHVMLTSFYHASVLKVKEHAAIRTGIIIASLPVFPVLLAADARADAIFPKYPRLNLRLVEDAKIAGIEVYPWVINTAEDARSVARLGVAGVVNHTPCSPGCR